MREGERIRMRGERDWCRKRFVKSITTMLMRGERERGSSVTGVIEWGRYRYTERERNGRKDERQRFRKASIFLITVLLNQWALETLPGVWCDM